MAFGLWGSLRGATYMMKRMGNRAEPLWQARSVVNGFFLFPVECKKCLSVPVEVFNCANDGIFESLMSENIDEPDVNDPIERLRQCRWRAEIVWLGLYCSTARSVSFPGIETLRLVTCL